MATRFCGICGTEVDDDAAFCPSCGNPLDAAEIPANDIPAAPAWPEPEPEPEPQAEPGPDREPEPLIEREPQPAADLNAAAAPEPVADAHDDRAPALEAEPTRLVPPARSAEAPRAAEGARAAEPPADAPTAAGRRPAAEQVELPFSMPVMLSGWLIGVGALVAALSLLLDFRTFVNPVTLLVFLVLLAVAASVFLASNIPDFPNRRLWVLVVVVAAFGIGLWRVGLGANFAGVVFFLASLAAAIGAILVELGQDRPMGGPVG